VVLVYKESLYFALLALDFVTVVFISQNAEKNEKFWKPSINNKNLFWPKNNEDLFLPFDQNFLKKWVFYKFVTKKGILKTNKSIIFALPLKIFEKILSLLVYLVFIEENAKIKSEYFGHIFLIILIFKFVFTIDHFHSEISSHSHTSCASF
jgi:hypothetical protein